MLPRGERGHMGQDTYSLEEVLSRGFEARCVGPDGTRYLWCQGSGLRVDPHTNETMLLTDATRLLDGPWLPTSFGLRQLAEDGADAAAVYP